ncbi:hypothetical protein [Salinarimonas ramus]|uniref:Uncharacterized protein n=1 Tax=Salinarimonas ramus TaxID=690164 RepID=A0A917Q4F1_9HYPH|nr:hypothetical protein [Salinarimonas ramus]GGK20289.1 hypothetical protein GCM10011322_03670 [Salinarimonas ramus]
MSWRGRAGIVIWNGVVPGAQAEFERWHDEEHIDERLAIPGFLGARRGLAIDGSGEYLTLYEVADADVITHGAYPERLNAPTEWTRRTLPLFRGAARSLCRVAETSGGGMGEGGGDHLVALRLPDGEALDAMTRADLWEEAARLVAEGVLLGAALLLRDDAASARRTAEHDLRAEHLATPAGALVGEADGEDAAITAATRLEIASPGASAGTYRLQTRR